MKTALATPSACPEQVTQDSSFYFDAAFTAGDFEEPELQKAAVALRAQGLRGVAVPRKKECLFLTNKATMLLKTRDRVYEQSQTKPILLGENPC